VLLAVFPAAPAGFGLLDAFALLKEPLTIVAALVLFCYIALEASFTNWLAPFGKEVLSREKPDLPTDRLDASAARLLSAFAIAMMAGRLITSFSGIAQFGGWLIAGAAVIAGVIIIIMTGVKSSSAAYMLAIASGLVFAPAFPTTVGVTFTKFGGGSGSLFGIIFAIGLAGAVIVPKAIGNLAKGASVQKSAETPAAGVRHPCAAGGRVAIRERSCGQECGSSDGGPRLRQHRPQLNKTLDHRSLSRATGSGRPAAFCARKYGLEWCVAWRILAAH